MPNESDLKFRIDKGESLRCSNRMFVSFIAARDISVHEELVISMTVVQSPADANHTDTTIFKYTTHEFGSQCL